MPYFRTSEYFLVQDSPITKIILVFLYVIVYRLCFKFLLVYSAKHREYQLVAKSRVPCF